MRAVPWKNADERDLILGRLRWMSAYLLERGFPHYVQCGERNRVTEVRDPGDLTDFLARTLGGKAGAAPAAAAPAHFSWVLNIDAKEGEA